MSYPYPGGADSHGSDAQSSYGSYGQSYGEAGTSAYQGSTSSYSPVAMGGGTPPCPPTHGGWAVAAIIFFWPLAFVALGRALEVYPLWAQGRYAEAQAASDTVRRMGKISLAIIAVFFVLYFGAIFLMIALGAANS